MTPRRAVPTLAAEPVTPLPPPLALPDFFRPADAPLLPLLTERLRVLECQAFALKLRQWLLQHPDWSARLLFTIDRSSVDNLPIKFEIPGLGQQQRAAIKQLTQDLRPLLTFANDPFAQSVSTWLRNANENGSKFSSARAIEIVESCLDHFTHGLGKECFRRAAAHEAGEVVPLSLPNQLPAILLPELEGGVAQRRILVETLLVQQFSIGVLDWERQAPPHKDAVVWLKSVYDDFDPCLMTIGGRSAQPGDDAPFLPLLALFSAHSRQKHRIFKELGDEVLRQFNKQGWNSDAPEECMIRAWSERHVGSFAEYAAALRASAHHEELSGAIGEASAPRARM